MVNAHAKRLALLYCRFALLTRKSRHAFCSDLRSGGKENLDTLRKTRRTEIKLLRVFNSILHFFKGTVGRRTLGLKI